MEINREIERDGEVEIERWITSQEKSGEIEMGRER